MPASAAATMAAVATTARRTAGSIVRANHGSDSAVLASVTGFIACLAALSVQC